MGQTTPNMGIYIPSAGETNYEQSFAAGMMNIDQHDHSGGPNKGVPITNSGLADFSVTYDKLNANVVDSTTGIGTQGGAFQNRLQLLGYLANLYQLSLTPGVGFVVMNGGVSNVRTFQNSSTVTWTNANGTGNPSASVNIAGLTPVAVANGGTGRTSLVANGILLGGTTTTNPMQQVVGDGVAQQYLGSNGPGVIPSWQTLPAFPTQNFQIATLTLNNAQLNAITSASASNVVIVPAQGAGVAVVVYAFWAKVSVGADRFHNGSSVRLYYGHTSREVGYVMTSGALTDTSSGFYLGEDTQTSSSTVIPTASLENRTVTVGINSSSFTGGAGSTVTFYCAYSLMQI